MVTRILRVVSAVSLLCSGLMVSGCGGGEEITLTYERMPEYKIPSDVRRVAVAEFGGQTRQDQRWGDIASDELAHALDEYNRQYDRYELVDRKRLGAIMDERDIQLAVSDTSSAVEMGEIADVDAIIYGSVRVNTRDERGTRTAFDPLRQSTKTVHYTRRYCMASVNFTMDDIETSKTLATVTVTREFDSEDDEGSAKMVKHLGFSGDGPPPTDQIVSGLISECVDTFVSKISPHKVVVTEELAGGESDAAKHGNEFATSGEYADALELYERAIETNPDDHGSMFNAGLMCEALGRFGEAERYYDRAIDLKVDKKYILARKRVRQEGQQ
ncbi:MAG: tetratricopeptide repeat protein [Phycisphaerae bacterium]